MIAALQILIFVDLLLASHMKNVKKQSRFIQRTYQPIHSR